MLERVVLRPFQRAVLCVMALALAAWLAFHMSMLLLFCLPPNPLGEAFRPLITTYMHPYFEQYWNMFAPNPIDGDYVLVARARHTGRQDGVTPWVNVTAALIHPVRANPLSPVSTLRLDSMKVVLGCLQDRSVAALQLNGKHPGGVRLPPLLPLALTSAMREAAFFGRAAWGEGTPIEAVQVAVVKHTPPRFTHRFERDDPMMHNTTVYFPWVPLDR
jgi:hypothetical protein